MSQNNPGTAAFIYLEKIILLLNQERVGSWAQSRIHCKKKNCRVCCKPPSIISSQMTSWFALQHRKRIFWPGMENAEHNMDETGAELTVKLWQGREGWSRAWFEQKDWDRNRLQEKSNSVGGAYCQAARVQEATWALQVRFLCQAAERSTAWSYWRHFLMRERGGHFPEEKILGPS